MGGTPERLAGEVATLSAGGGPDALGTRREDASLSDCRRGSQFPGFETVGPGCGRELFMATRCRVPNADGNVRVGGELVSEAEDPRG